MLKCTVCDHEFQPHADKRYTAQDKRNIFIDGTLYDAFDCPVCGCQIIANERKRSVEIDSENTADATEGEACDSEEAGMSDVESSS